MLTTRLKSLPNIYITVGEHRGLRTCAACPYRQIRVIQFIYVGYFQQSQVVVCSIHLIHKFQSGLAKLLSSHRSERKSLKYIYNFFMDLIFFSCSRTVNQSWTCKCSNKAWCCCTYHRRSVAYTVATSIVRTRTSVRDDNQQKKNNPIWFHRLKLWRPCFRNRKIEEVEEEKCYLLIFSWKVCFQGFDTKTTQPTAKWLLQ